MEETRRRSRLDILCSHLYPIKSAVIHHDPISHVSSSNCDSSRSNETRKIVDDCVFCKIISGQSPALKLYEDDTCLCILDTNPLSHGHALLIPKSHFSSLETTPSSVVAAMCSKVPFISNAILKVTSSDSFNLLVNSGAAAGQVIFHTHIHIIPRKARDRLWASESLQRRPLESEDEASELAGRVREQLKSSEIYQESNCS